MTSLELCYTPNMRNPYGAIAWILAWAAAAVLTLLLFAIMSLFVLRTAQTPAPAISAPPAPSTTQGVNAAGAEAVTPEPQTPALTPAATPATGEAQPDATATIGLWLSAISAITALLGLASSLWLGWRKERREVTQHLLELERTQLEVEKLRRELGKNA